MTDSPVIHWFRRDLRLTDNLALREALKTRQPVIPLFIVDPALRRGEKFGLPRLKFMLDGLSALDDLLREYGTRLLVRHGDPREMLPALVDQTGATAVYFNRDYTPYAARRENVLKDRLRVPFIGCDDAMLHPPDTIKTKGEGKPYTVYTPYRNQWFELPKPAPAMGVIEGKRFHTLEGVENSGVPTLAELGFSATIPVPTAGELVARKRLVEFTSGAIFTYAEDRNRLIPNPFDEPPPQGTSYLSPYLRMGMISPRQMFDAAKQAWNHAETSAQRHSVEVWMSELAWREFYMGILYHFPQVYHTSFRPEFEKVEWRSDADDFQRWSNGQTGFPIIDAAMRQMNAIGWMHNRARMIVASFMTKDLLLHWRMGENDFMQKLIDGDPAANNGGWQWAAGTGTDAQPYFRIFNPVSQSQKFDPRGEYIRYWIPELRDVPDKHIHAPHEMAIPPTGYPPPMVDHAWARQRTLDAFKAVKQETDSGKY